MPVDEGQVLQVQRFPLRCFGVDDPLQLGDVLDADSTTHGEDHEGAPHRSLDPQHRCPSRGGAKFDSGECTSRSVRNRGASCNYAKTLAMGVCRVTTLRKFPKRRYELGVTGRPGSDAYQRSVEGVTAGSGTGGSMSPLGEKG